MCGLWGKSEVLLEDGRGVPLFEGGHGSHLIRDASVNVVFQMPPKVPVHLFTSPPVTKFRPKILSLCTLHIPQTVELEDLSLCVIIGIYYSNVLFVAR